MSDEKVVAFINTPIKAGDLSALLSGEGVWDMVLDVGDDGLLVVRW